LASASEVSSHSSEPDPVLLQERNSFGGYMGGSYENSYGGGFNDGTETEIGFTGGFLGEQGYAGGDQGGYAGEGYDYDTDVASLTQGKVMAEERTNFGYGGGHGGGYGSSHGGGYGGGYGHSKGTGTGTACIVKGSYCNCHYCKCEKGHISCGGYGHGGGYGKKYCYGGMEGEYCHCDYCKCKNGFGFASKGGYGHKGSGGCGDH